MAAPKKTRSKIGVIGLGIIGTRVAANLRSAGHQVYVWSRTPRAAPNFLGSVVEVADLCDVIELFISDDRALQEVIRTVAAALRPRHVVLCHATVSPEATRHAAGIVESQGARYLDAPFTGSKAAAQNKQLVYYIGGAKAALEEVRPVLEATSRAILHVGGIGDASVLKIATNMLTASTVQTLAEALALVRAAGIDGSKLVEALENNASRSGTSDLKLPAMIAANAEPNFSLKHMLKDVRFAQELADKYQLSLPLTDTTAEVFAMGIQNDWGDKDFSVVGQLYPAPPPPSIKPVPAGKALVPVPVVASAPVSLEPASVPVNSPEAIPGKPAVDAVESLAAVPEKTVPESGKAPAAASGKSASELVTALAPVPEDRLAGLVLPPRPKELLNQVDVVAPATEGKSADRIGEKPQDLPGPLAHKQDKPGFTDQKEEAIGKKDDRTERKDNPGTADAAKKPELPSADASSPKAGEARNGVSSTVEASSPADTPAAVVPLPKDSEAARKEKKRTFQFLRNFFKPVPTEPR